MIMLFLRFVHDHLFLMFVDDQFWSGLFVDILSLLFESCLLFACWFANGNKAHKETFVGWINEFSIKKLFGILGLSWLGITIPLDRSFHQTFGQVATTVGCSRNPHWPEGPMVSLVALPARSRDLLWFVNWFALLSYSTTDDVHMICMRMHGCTYPKTYVDIYICTHM